MKTHIKAITGSRAYGLATAESDNDWAEVFSPSPDQFYGFPSYEERRQEISPDGTSDVNYWSARSLVIALYAGNHLAHELLYTEKYEADLIGRKIIDFARNQLYSAALGKRLLAFSKAMLNNFQRTKDFKQLSHAYRASCYLEELLLEGRFHTFLSTENEKICRSILHEKDIHYILGTRNKLDFLAQGLEGLKLPDFNLYNDFCIKIHKEIYS